MSSPNNIPIVLPSIQRHELPMHQHGKGRVRLGRTWRDPNGVHHFVEWTVHTMLESAMEHSFFTVRYLIRLHER